MYLIKLQSLYGLKQSRCMSYNHLSDYLLSKGYVNNSICPCVFVKKKIFGFVIIVVYVDDLNIIGTNKEIVETTIYLQKEFDKKRSRKNQILFVHQSTYTEKVLKWFNMDKVNPLSTPMVC